MPSPYQEHASSGNAVFLTTLLISELAIALRLIARARAKVSFDWDDYWIIGAGILLIVQNGFEVWAVVNGAHGYSYDDVPDEYVRVELIALYAGDILLYTSIALIKLSVLYLYRRIFGVNRKFNLAVNILIGITVLWGIVVVVGNIVQCDPVPLAWDPHQPADADCASLPKGLLGSETVNMVSEVALIILPLFMLQRIQLSLRRKYLLSLIFALGIFTIAVSIIRIIQMYRPYKNDGNLTTEGYWSNIQQMTAIMVACAPTYRSLLPREVNVKRGFTRVYYTLFASRSDHTRHAHQGTGSGNSKERYDNVTLPTAFFPTRQTSHAEHVYKENDVPMGQIEVTRDVTMA